MPEGGIGSSAPDASIIELDEPVIDGFYGPDTLNKLLVWAVDNDYSDVIITSEQPILYRRHRLTFRSRQRALSEAQVADTARWLASEGAAVRALTGDFCDVSYATPRCLADGSRQRFRVNVTAIHSSRCENAIAIVLRAVSGEPWDLEQHQLPSALQRSCFSDAGLNLVAGPMGSGKTTLVTSIIKEINLTTQRYIVSYEDPVEFDFGLVEGISIPVAQTEINKGVKSFTDALTNVTRRSADVIYWGESRDPDSIRSLTVACDLGAAVYSTVHANSVATTIQRLVRMFPDEQRDGMQAALIASLQVLVYQRLIPKLNGGAVALREYLVFDDELKDRLMDLPLARLSKEIRRAQLNNGSDLLSALDHLFETGQINRKVHATIKQHFTKGEN